MTQINYTMSVLAHTMSELDKIEEEINEKEKMKRDIMNKIRELEESLTIQYGFHQDINNSLEGLYQKRCNTVSEFIESGTKQFEQKCNKCFNSFGIKETSPIKKIIAVGRQNMIHNGISIIYEENPNSDTIRVTQSLYFDNNSIFPSIAEKTGKKPMFGCTGNFISVNINDFFQTISYLDKKNC